MEKIETLKSQLKVIKRKLIELRLEESFKKIDNESKINELEKEGNEIIQEISSIRNKKNQYFVSFNYENIITNYNVNVFNIIHCSDIDCKINTRTKFLNNENEYIKLRNEIIEKYISDYMYRINNLEIIRI
ncbi:MAG: hypothetical protein HOO91_01090 [Bacteroidales bacterium]|nr:hypothetical protein [Bacteroidales bacterium]